MTLRHRVPARRTVAIPATSAGPSQSNTAQPPLATGGCALPNLPTTEEDGAWSNNPVGRPSARLKRGDPSPDSCPAGGRSAEVIGSRAPREASQPAPLPRASHATAHRHETRNPTGNKQPETTFREQQASLPSRGHCARTFRGPGAMRAFRSWRWTIYFFTTRRAPSFPGCVSRFAATTTLAAT